MTVMFSFVNERNVMATTIFAPMSTTLRSSLMTLIDGRLRSLQRFSCLKLIGPPSEFDLDGKLWPHRTPLPESCHPELHDSDFLPELGIRRFQTLIDMAQWACTIGRLDIDFAVSSLSRFSAAPRVHHLELVFYLFGYLKKNPNRWIVLDSRPLIVDNELWTDSFHPDFLEDYPDESEDIDESLPLPYGSELVSTSVFLY